MQPRWKVGIKVEIVRLSRSSLYFGKWKNTTVITRLEDLISLFLEDWSKVGTGGSISILINLSLADTENVTKWEWNFL